MIEVVVYNKKFQIEQDIDFGVVEKFIEEEYYERRRLFNKRYAPDHVFDADKSVNWNREQVEIRNKQIEYGRIGCQEEKIASDIILKEALHQYVAVELKRQDIPAGRVDTLYTYLRDNFDHEWYKYLDETLILIRIMNGEED